MFSSGGTAIFSFLALTLSLINGYKIVILGFLTFPLLKLMV